MSRVFNRKQMILLDDKVNHFFRAETGYHSYILTGVMKQDQSTLRSMSPLTQYLCILIKQKYTF